MSKTDHDICSQCEQIFIHGILLEVPDNDDGCMSICKECLEKALRLLE